MAALFAYTEGMAPTKKTPFAARLRELRDQAGLTQAQLADRAGLHLSAVTRFEQGFREPSWATAMALAKALGVSCEEFNKEPMSILEPKRGRPSKGLRTARTRRQKPTNP